MPSPVRSSAPPDHPAPATEPRPARPSAKALGKRRETFHGTLPGENEGGEGEATGDESKGGPPKKRVLPYRARRTGMGGLGSSSIDEMVLAYAQQRDEEPLIPHNAVIVLTTREKGLPPPVEPEKPVPLLTNGAASSSSSAPQISFKKLSEIDLVGGRLRARAEEVEDTSDAAYLARHRKYEATERRQRKREVEKLTHEHYLLKQRMHEYSLMDAAAFGGEEKKRAILHAAEELDRKYQALLGPRVEKPEKDAMETVEPVKDEARALARGRPRARMSEPPLHHTLPKPRPKPSITYSRHTSARSTPQPSHLQSRVAELRASEGPVTTARAARSPSAEPDTPPPDIPARKSRQLDSTEASPSSVVRIHGRDGHGRFAPKPVQVKRTASGRQKPGHAGTPGEENHRKLTASRSMPNLLSRKRTRTPPPPATPVLVRAASRPSRTERNLRRPTAFGVPLGSGAEEEREFKIPAWVEVQYPVTNDDAQGHEAYPNHENGDRGEEWLGEEATQEIEMKDEDMDDPDRV